MSGGPKKDGETVSLMGIPMKWVSLLMLIAQTVSVVFAMRLSRTSNVAGPRYLNTTAVFFSELLKLLCSFLFLTNEKGSFHLAFSVTRENLTSNFMETLKITVPGALYTLQNNLLFVSLSNLSGAVYQVTYQLKILTTAVLSVIILGKALGKTKWCSLFMLFAGVALIQLPRGESANSSEAAKGNPIIGLAAVLSACVTSGFAGVFLEKLLKQTTASIWVRNIQLALFGSGLGLVGCFIQDGDKILRDGFLQGYSSLVWSVIFLQAVGGLVVASVLKYADNILKCFGNAVSIVLSCILSGVFLHEFTPDLLFVIGTILVLVATTIYNLGLPQNVQRMFASQKSKVDTASSIV